MYFYGTMLGFDLGKVGIKRRIAFYWLGKRGKAMLGLWETPEHLIHQHHYALSSTLEAVLHQSVQFLQHRGISPCNSLGED